jgi:hypothetical protein
LRKARFVNIDQDARYVFRVRYGYYPASRYQQFDIRVTAQRAHNARAKVPRTTDHDYAHPR